MSQGDLTLTVAKSVTGLTLLEFIITFSPYAAMTVIFAEGGTGAQHVSRITNTDAVGWDYSAGVFTDNVNRVISGELTTMLGILFGAGASTPNQRKTASIQRLITSGVNTVAATVG